MLDKSCKSDSLKQEWDKEKRNRFERTLTQNGWEVYRKFKESTLYQKGAKRIEVDSWGAWLFELFRESGLEIKWIRTQGISDDRVDQIFSPGHDHNILPFKQAHNLKRLDLSTAVWVK